MNTKPTTETLIDPLQEQGCATIRREKLRRLLNFLKGEPINSERDRIKVESAISSLEEWLK